MCVSILPPAKIVDLATNASVETRRVMSVLIIVIQDASVLCLRDTLGEMMPSGQPETQDRTPNRKLTG